MSIVSLLPYRYLIECRGYSPQDAIEGDKILIKIWYYNTKNYCFVMYNQIFSCTKSCCIETSHITIRYFMLCITLFSSNWKYSIPRRLSCVFFDFLMKNFQINQTHCSRYCINLPILGINTCIHYLPVSPSNLTCTVDKNTPHFHKTWVLNYSHLIIVSVRFKSF